MLKRLILIFACAAMAASVYALDFSKVKFHDEKTDTSKINDILASVKKKGDYRLPGKYLMLCGEEFLGKPYVAHTLEGEPEMLTINIDEFDCVTFVENMLAMALTLDEGRSSWRDFVYNLQRIRYRGGEVNGYPSRLHYVCDWAVDNMYRGTIIDATGVFERVNNLSRTMDFMSANAEKYPALADSANLAGIKKTESGYRLYKFPYIKTIDLGRKEVKSSFKNGDILAFVSNLKNLDVSHMGLVKIQDGEPYVMHASSIEGKVVVSKLPLAEFMKKNRQFVGVRVFRISNK
ncbi:MAG: DUF1460 domain-containing protein [Clostridium sp.]|nr:DUF1460 domain-containing protein [Clostridium sp.]